MKESEPDAIAVIDGKAFFQRNCTDLRHQLAQRRFQLAATGKG